MIQKTNASEAYLPAINDIARQLAALDTGRYYANFEWAGVGMPDAWKARERLEQLGKCALVDPMRFADEVHKWGFRNAPVKEAVRKNPHFEPALKNLLLTWTQGGLSAESKPHKLRALTEMLQIPLVGIATASKWICFLNQGSYAIYDSRVSLALREIVVNGCRPFPIVSRRSLADKKAWRQDLGKGQAKLMAEAYWAYLLTLESLATVDRRTVVPSLAANVEMALFMMGNVWPDERDRISFKPIQ